MQVRISADHQDCGIAGKLPSVLRARQGSVVGLSPTSKNVAALSCATKRSS